MDSPDPVSNADGSGPDYALPLAEETYVQIRDVAHRELRKRGGHISIETTDLVHHAYDRLERRGGQWDSRAHFLAVAGKAMWQILVDHARERSAKKRGGDHHRVSVRIAELYATPRSVDVLNLEETMTRLGSLDAVQGRSVSAVHPIFSATDRIADHSEPCSEACSATRRTARSLTSGE